LAGRNKEKLFMNQHVAQGNSGSDVDLEKRPVCHGGD